MRLFRRSLVLCSVLITISGCASRGVVDNTPVEVLPTQDTYSLRTYAKRPTYGKTAVTVAFSGGGTRAAALAYGVLLELRDTPWTGGDETTPTLLAEVDSISSVSGGSFTSAYYGLYGDRIFDDFEDRFLRKDIQGALVGGLLNPFRWFSPEGRTEMAVNIYQKELFEDATFEDMLKREDSPLIVINASDLGYGVRFSFIQEYFDLLCSDLTTFSVARAVAASSAVPVVFNPVVVRNYPDCGSTPPPWLVAAKKRAIEQKSLRLQVTVDGLETYFDKDARKYAHFVDGGITDNLGLLATFDYMAISGGINEYIKKNDRVTPRRLVVISVDASTSPEPEMDKTDLQPSIAETVGAMSNVQLHRYNVSTDELFKRAVNHWAEVLSTPEQSVEAYLIRVSLDTVADPEEQAFFDKVPTSFSLTDEQVDRLIEIGGRLLRENPEFRRLLADSKGLP